MTIELTIVIPTFNERDNVKPCIQALSTVLGKVKWEAIFVDDDSNDGTSDLIRALARENPAIRVIQRLKRRGLSSACIEGILASSAPYVAVMDVDLQHDEKILPQMFSVIKQEDLDLVIGSRYVTSGSTGDLSGFRVLLSRFATRMGSLLLKSEVQDPMSGYFIIRREFFERVMHRLSGKGFKILLDILATVKENVRYREVPYKMRSRLRGESKLDSVVAWDFLTLLIDKIMGRLLPARFILFAMVGMSGVLVHFIMLGLLHTVLTTGFLPAQLLATYFAMTSNYILNNMITYRDIRLKGKEFIRGLFSFYIFCSFGALINIVLAGHLFEKGFAWWLAGILGALSGAVWNYALTAVLTWKVENR